MVALKDSELVPEAIVEHATIKGLIAEVEGATRDGENFDAKVKVPSECVKHQGRAERDVSPGGRHDAGHDGAWGRIASRKDELSRSTRAERNSS